MVLLSFTLYRSYFLFPFIIYFSNNLNRVVEGIILGTLSLIYFFIADIGMNKLTPFIKKRYIIYFILLLFTFLFNILFYLDLHYAQVFFPFQGSFFLMALLLIPFIIPSLFSRMSLDSWETIQPLKKEKKTLVYHFIIIALSMILLSLLRELLTTGTIFYEIQGTIYQISFVGFFNQLFHTNYLFNCPFFSSFIGGGLLLSIFLLPFFKDANIIKAGH